ncbi:MAG TPA: serine/threonine-protein kinase [Streptosporangiaceae bacterium]|nr:serine/threonine-protein kinase [Streptosporangiaceae bacterium]
MTEPQSGVRTGGEPLRRWDPDRIGPYVILGRLGAGAMGQVYLGRSAAGRLVAVKTIKVDLAEEAGFRTRFAQEVAAARKVSGFFTAAVVQADPEADLPWLATAYVPAPSLARLVKACGPLPAGTVRWLAAGCAEALASIHGAGLVHRDLKPSNVLVAPDGPRVIDFGVARAAERMGLSTSRGAVGTPAYMAPEQARDTHQASAASDVYALGATLLFAATGHPPYRGESVMDVLARLATEDPDLSGLPGELTGLITACLARVPRDRPTSSAMLARLGQFTETRPGEHSYLPDEAMALIAQYQSNPLLAAGQPRAEDSTDDSVADSTSASYTDLPASNLPRMSPRRPAGWRHWVRTHLAWAAWASVGAALVVGGVILGAALSGSSHPETDGPPNGLPPAPPTVCGNFQAPPGPGLCMVKQSQGTAATAFTVQGNGFAAGSSVTFKVSELDPGNNNLFSASPPLSVTVSPDGTFRVAFRKLYSSPLSLGLVTVDASGPGGAHATTEFMIIPSGAPPAP